MKGRFIVIVLDGFGIGAMKDAAVSRPKDKASSTLGSILHDYPDLKLPVLEDLGLMNAYGKESRQMRYAPCAIFGQCDLQHFGADTFMGHQELMGTTPERPLIQPFQMKIEEIAAHLIVHGHQVAYRGIGTLRYLLVDGVCTVADNIDADVGMAYNCTAPLDDIAFEDVLSIARLVREVATVNRVIAFGGTGNRIEDILAAEEVRKDAFIGIHAVNSKSYEQGYQCLHLGYGVDKRVQVPFLLSQAGIPVSLFGKVADIVENEKGKRISCVDTTKVLSQALQELKQLPAGFLCANVQETDLAGHSQDSGWYQRLLQLADEGIGRILRELDKEDILVVMADHGNDPNIGHNQHTRERVPLLVYRKERRPVKLGLRTTLSDVGATVCDYFQVPPPQNGTSFLSLITEGECDKDVECIGRTA